MQSVGDQKEQTGWETQFRHCQLESQARSGECLGREMVFHGRSLKVRLAQVWLQPLFGSFKPQKALPQNKAHSVDKREQTHLVYSSQLAVRHAKQPLLLHSYWYNFAILDLRLVGRRCTARNTHGGCQVEACPATISMRRRRVERGSTSILPITCPK